MAEEGVCRSTLLEEPADCDVADPFAMMRGMAEEGVCRGTLLEEAAECEDEVYGVALSDGD
eukprot:2563314-Alexandrium_andersonii.AAC.1